MKKIRSPELRLKARSSVRLPRNKTHIAPTVAGSMAMSLYFPNRSLRRMALYRPEILGTKVKMTPVFRAVVVRSDKNISQKKPVRIKLIQA